MKNLKYIFIKNYKDKKRGDIVDELYFNNDDILIHCLLDACVLEYIW